MNKGKISSEELRLQLAESLPGAIQIFARSINKSEAELFKMMENGELLAADVLPKVAKEMKKVAAVGLEDKLDTLRVAQGQFFNELQKAGDTIFQSGFAEGLKDMFFTISEFLKGNEDSLEGFGKGFKMAFNLMDGALKLILPILGAIGRALGTVHDSLTAIFGEDLFIDAGTQVSGLGLAFTALAVKMSPVYRMALAIIGVMDEIAALFSTGRLGILEVALGKDIDISKADLDLFDIVTATSNPMKLMELNEKMNGSSGVFTDVNRSRINNSLELKVTTDKESTVEVVKKELSKEYDVNILSGAF